MNVFDVLDITESTDTSSDLVPRCYLKDIQDPFKKFDDVQFAQRFRFSKAAVHELHSIIKDDEDLQMRAHALNPMLQLVVALRFYATGNFQITDGDLTGVSRHTFRRSVHRITSAICKKKDHFISFPRIDQYPHVKEAFFRIAGFPGVIGAIDCTHVRILSPGGQDAEVFRNRKGYFSVNVQAICDANRNITNIVARWPGSTHDSRIFDNSQIRDLLHDAPSHGYLLGDNGYGCKPYLITPLLNPSTVKEKRYNNAHVKTRARIEHCFGVLKKRFHALDIPLRTRLDRSLAIIVAAACMHNFAVHLRQALPDITEQDEHEQEGGMQTIQQSSARGHAFRQSLIEQYF